ncbi:asparagine synthetase [Candidatus Magnetobacterium bavaricum]|uniref:asparagine synthase (glutamine-hydrolyzing) n=1 Tax=Candidatus Magnetobacterium bavaricum TaxID=29290 RepID=A0A0F3GN06_9BACT|nr:asparagine synthetase [Candidatus Magnetobacterium bavaricum]
MCGIAGFYLNRKRENEYPEYLTKAECLLKNMLKIVDYRGPDQTGFFTDGICGLGMNRLSIINVNEEDIPYFNEDKTLALVFNGEIYNYKDIRMSLKEDHNFKSDSDTEVVLHTYEELGVDCAKHFNGMYAFAVVDFKKKEMTIVRDKVGEKPLFYYYDGNDFYFGSEIKSILCAVEAEFNDDCMSYNVFEVCIDEETLFKNIYSLLPGEFLNISAKGLKKGTYWSVWNNVRDIPDNEAWIRRELTDLLVDAVELRTKNTAHHYACLVSGGVDSAMVASIAKPEFLYTTTYDQYGDDYNELHYAQLVSKKVGKELHVIRPRPEHFNKYKAKIVYHLDLPATWTSFSMFCVLEELSKTSKVFITGEGIDEIFGGYHRYHLLVHDQKIYELEALTKYTYLIEKYYGSPADRYARIINRATDIYNERNNKYLREKVDSFFKKSNSVVHGMGMTDFYTSLQVILHMSDRVSMAYSIENRAPFVDHRLLEFGFGMPDKYKIRNGITKHIIKEIARKFIPEQIVERKDKKGFLAPVNLWFGWGDAGRYDRSGYKIAVFEDWKDIFINKKYGWPPVFKD